MTRAPRICTILLSIAAGWAATGCDGEMTGPAEPPKPNPSAVKPFEMGVPDVVLLITGGTNGRMEVCNCSGPMPGGLARRSGLARSYRAVYPQTVLIDGSDAFWVDPKDIRNGFLTRGYEQIGYDAFVLGNHEWTAWPQPLAGLIAQHKIPYLSSTIAPAKPPKDWPVRNVIRRDLGKVKLAVVSALLEESILFFPEEALAAMRFLSLKDLVRQVEQLKKDGCVVVAVVPMMDENFEKAVAAIPADLFVQAHTQRCRKDVFRVAGKPVVKIGGQEMLGAVALKVDGARVTGVELRVETVDTRWPMDMRLIQTYQAYAHAAMREALDKERTAGLDYVSSAECGKCHKPQYENWRKTPHARAWATLDRVKGTIDPNCVMCHTSGFGTAKGFYTLQRTPELANVNCQDCHRVNVGEHQKDNKPVGFKFPKVDELVCTTCHTPVTDAKFDFKAKLPKARCPKTVH